MTTPRKDWDNGPWDTEADERLWVDEATGYWCHMRRNCMGAWCGYVQLPEDHILHKLAYTSELPPELAHLQQVVLGGPAGKRGSIDVLIIALGGVVSVGALFDVHGSVTYSGGAYWSDDSGNWYGFDCSHVGDQTPRRGLRAADEVYRTRAYVEAECASLAQQLKQVAK